MLCNVALLLELYRMLRIIQLLIDTRISADACNERTMGCGSETSPVECRGFRLTRYEVFLTIQFILYYIYVTLCSSEHLKCGH